MTSVYPAHSVCRWSSGTRSVPDTSPSFRFQFKGLYPALEEASRVSPGFRGRLEHLVDEVDCTVCGGSRLRDDAAAVRFRGRTIDEICRQPLGKMLADFLAWKPTATRAENRR